MRDNEMLTAHSSEPLRLSDCRTLVVDVCTYLNLREPPTRVQQESLVDFMKTQFGNLSSDDVILAFKRAASGQLGFEPDTFNQLSIFFWGKVLSTYTKQLQQNTPKELPPEYRGLSPEEFVTSGTKAKVDAVIEELARKKTDWRNKGSEASTNSLTHDQLYDMKMNQFVIAYQDRFGSRVAAREVWEKTINRARWNESTSLAWVDEEIGKLIM